MYYHSRQHKTRCVRDAFEAAHLIHTGYVTSFDALTWETNGKKFVAVADGHIDDLWFEVAVIRIDTTTPVQIESLTFGWMKTEEEKASSLRECETMDFPMWNTLLPLDGSNEECPVDFTCGCCDRRFISTIKKQRHFDQDEGYGICPRCQQAKL